MVKLNLIERTSKFRKVGMIAAVATAIFSAPVLAEDAKGRMDEKALSVLKEMSDYLGSSQTISFRVNTFFDVVRKSGIKIKAGRSSRIVMKRPKHLSIFTEGDDGRAATIWYDGKKLTWWQRDANKVMGVDFAGTTDEMFDHLVKKYDVQIPLADLLYSDINSTFAADLKSAEHVGMRVVDGVKCHQLSFESIGVDWQIWVEADATPVPRRLVMDFVAEKTKPQYMAQMGSWSVDGEIGDYNFNAALPDGVKQVEFTLKPVD